MNPMKFLAMVEMKKVLYSCEDEDLARITGVSQRTFKRRKQNPGQFTIAEVERIMNVLQFTEEERKEVFCK